MNLSGFTEKGFKRKLAVQALFGKILYLSEVRHSSIICHDYIEQEMLDHAFSSNV